MYRIIDGRGTGKTSRLMLLAKENNAVVVCKHPQAMEVKAHAYGIVGLKFLSYDAFIQNKCGVGSNKIYLIDELDEFLKTITFDRIIGYSISQED